MAENAAVHARIDEATKIEVAAVLATIRPSLSKAFPLLLERVAAEKASRFKPLISNAATLSVMKAARADAVTASKPKSLLASLSAVSP